MGKSLPVTNCYPMNEPHTWAVLYNDRWPEVGFYCSRCLKIMIVRNVRESAEFEIIEAPPQTSNSIDGGSDDQ